MSGRIVEFEDFAADEETSTESEVGTLIQSSADFIAGFIPPDYQVDGVLQRRRPIGDHAVEQGKVLYFAGENPDDVRMRWIAMAQHMDFDASAAEVYFIPGVSLSGVKRTSAYPLP